LLKKFLFLFIGLIFYIAVIGYSDFGQFFNNVSKFQFELLPLILGLGFIAMLIRGLRQQILLKKIGVKVPLKESILLYLSGLSMIVTPGGSGQLIKSYFLKIKFGFKISKTLPLVFVERLHDLIALLCITIFTLIIIQNHSVSLIVGIVTFFTILSYTALRYKILFEKILNFLHKIPILNRQLANFSNFYDGLYLMTSWKTTIKCWLLSLFAWSLEAIVVYLVFLGFDLNLDAIFSIFVMFSSMIFGVITLLPAGLGVTEISAIGFLTEKSVNLSMAISTIIMVRMVSIWYSTLIGLITTKFILRIKDQSKQNDE
jgi:glycosyltransferase 2 family protein